MYVIHEGWNKDHGSFSYKIFVDEAKTNHQINYSSGKYLKQDTAFRTYTHDWNNDGDVYSEFGAFFKCYDRNGKLESQGIFMTPVDMVSELIRGTEEPRRKYDDVVVSISGIDIPSPSKRPTINEQIQSSERRCMAQEIERNRKMNALGIRNPGEPWVR